MRYFKIEELKVNIFLFKRTKNIFKSKLNISSVIWIYHEASDSPLKLKKFDATRIYHEARYQSLSYFQHKKGNK